MKRISVTTIEKFRRYMTEASSFDTEDALIESLSGIFKGNDKTYTGSAYHKILEGEYKIEGNLVIVHSDNKTWAFHTHQAEPAIRYFLSHKNMAHEVSVKKVYQTTYCGIQVSGRVDGLEGNIIRDGKTRFRSVVPTDYVESCQSKFYLDILGLDEFYYDVFEFIGFEQLPLANPIILNDVTVVPHEPIQCLRTQDMEDYIHSLLHDFLSYIDNRGIWHLLKDVQDETVKLEF